MTVLTEERQERQIERKKPKTTVLNFSSHRERAVIRCFCCYGYYVKHVRAKSGFFFFFAAYRVVLVDILCSHVQLTMTVTIYCCGTFSFCVILYCTSCTTRPTEMNSQDWVFLFFCFFITYNQS